MDKDIRQKLETAASNLREVKEEQRVPAFIRRLGDLLTFVIMALCTSFGLYAGLFYANQGQNPGENGPLLTGIGLFLGLMVGTIAGVSLRKLLYRIFSQGR
jgi:hypothetical protein